MLVDLCMLPVGSPLEVLVGSCGKNEGPRRTTMRRKWNRMRRSKRRKTAVTTRSNEEEVRRKVFLREWTHK